MEASINNPNICFQNAYEQINFYQSKRKTNKPAVTCSTGSANLAGIFSQNRELNNGLPQQIVMCAQPFYVGQVDHNIEQIGIMAVKQVRYVDDEEWEQMLKQNQRYINALQKQKKDEIKQIRKVYATKRPRNQKGQFAPKTQPKEQKRNNKDAKKQKRKVICKKDKKKKPEVY